MEWVMQFLADKPLVRLLDIAIVWYIIYRLLVFTRGTRAMNLLKGVAVIIVARAISSFIGLQTVDWMLDQVISWGVVAMIILFQPELRKALEVIGKGLGRNRRNAKNPSEKLVEDLVASVVYMSKRKIGALIVVERNDSLKEYIQTGIPIDSLASHQLVTNIFVPNTPLHDGAMIISDYRITAAACYLPLSESDRIPKELGTRHRAAIGLGEVTDAVTIVVSEETGSISVVKQDHLKREIKATLLSEVLNYYLVDTAPVEERDNWTNIREFLVSNFKQKGER